MLAILGGGAAALCFAAATLAATVAARRIGAGPALAWVALIGLCLLVVPILLFARPAELRGDTWWLLGLAGLCNAVGLRLLYHAFTRGPVGAITAIASTEGAVVTVISVIAGARIGALKLLLLALTSAGVALIAARPHEQRHDLRSTLPAVLAAAALFGTSLYLISEGSAHGATLWAAFAPRIAGTALITAPLAARRRIQLPRRVAPIVAVAAAAEVLGFLAYVIGARHGVAVSAVLTSQYVGLAVLGGYVLFGETLTGRQIGGVGLTAVGIAALALTGG